jgi:hypothetical protein
VVLIRAEDEESAMVTDVMVTAPPARLRRRNPVSLLFSAAPWASAGYLAGYLVVGAAWFVLSLSLLVVSGVLAITWIGLPLLVGALAVVRGLAAAERGRARIVGARIGPAYRRRAARPGLRAEVIRRLGDPATWRDIVALVVLWPVLLVLDLVALIGWLLGLLLISLPFWYRYVPNDFDNGTSAHGIQLGYYPNGPHGSERYGFFIGDLHSALGAAGIGLLVLMLVGNYLVVGAARAHVRTIGALLGS